MEQADQIQQDLHYVRGALERHHQLQRSYFPMPLALLVSGYLLLTAVAKTLLPGWREAIATWGSMALVAGAISIRWYLNRRRDEVPKCSAGDLLTMWMPWLGLAVAGVLLWQINAHDAMPPEALTRLILLLVGFTAFVSGLSGFPAAIGLGLGIGAGLAADLAIPNLPDFVLALTICFGLVGGAWVADRPPKAELVSGADRAA